MKQCVIFFSLLAAVATAQAQTTVFLSDTLTAGSPTFPRPNGMTNGKYAYSVQKFNVTQFGNYVLETSGRGTPEVRGLDTFQLLYAGAFIPTDSGANAIGLADDFSGLLQLLPGPYSADGLTPQATGAGGVQPSTQMIATNLMPGVDYFLVNTSWFTNEYQPGVGRFWSAIGGGPGEVKLAVPEPRTAVLWALGLGAVLACRRQRRAPGRTPRAGMGPASSIVWIPRPLHRP